MRQPTLATRPGAPAIASKVLILFCIVAAVAATATSIVTGILAVVSTPPPITAPTHLPPGGTLFIANVKDAKALGTVDTTQPLIATITQCIIAVALCALIVLLAQRLRRETEGLV